MKNFAWINSSNGDIENIIWYDGVTPIVLPEGIILVEIPEGLHGSWSSVTAGWSYIDGQFVEPPQPEPPPQPEQPTTTGSQTL